MALAEGKRRRLINQFKMMFPEMAENAVKYGEFRGDNETLSITLNDNRILAFSYSFSSTLPDWKLQSYRNYYSRLKQTS